MKKQLSSEEIDALAKLSQLQLSPAQKAKIASQFSETIEYVANLNDLDTASVDSVTNITGQTNRYFEDGTENKRGFSQEVATKQAKEATNGFFTVPKILSK